jgi:hypothetical protein
MELTRKDLNELRMARRIAQHLWCQAYDAQRPYAQDPNTFASVVERDAEQIRDLLDRVLGEDDHG